MPTLRVVATAALLALASPAEASADRLVVPGGPTFLSVGDETIAFDGHVYFAADDGVKGNELWRTDGTAGGTTLVQDFNTGIASDDGNPSGFRVVGNRLYFNVGNNDASEGSLVVYYLEPGGAPQKALLPGGAAANGSLIGAVGGKVLLRQLENGNSNYGLYSLGAPGSTFTKVSSGFNNVSTEPAATLGGFAYFSLCPNACSAYELYRTDGSTVSLVEDILPGPSGSGPTDLVATGDRVYFEAADGFAGRELWVTDGSELGTHIVTDQTLGSGSTSITPTSVANGNTLFYFPNDPGTGAEPWRTDGTPGGTSLVKDITPGTTGSGIPVLFAFNSGFGMVGNSDVHVSDGTAAGTTKVADVDSDGYGAAFLGVAGSRAYFRGGYSPFGGALWRTDGTAAGTGALTAGEFNLATQGFDSLLARSLTALGDKVIFFGHYPHAAGDPVPTSARRIYVLDTSQPDATRQATTAPSITGTPAVGQPLTGDKGTWTLETDNEYEFQWLRDGVAIPGTNARNSPYRPVAADGGTQLSFQVTASGLGLPNKVIAVSAPVTVGGSAPPATTPPVTTTTTTTTRALTVRKRPKLPGTARVGQRLKVTLPTFTQSGVKITFRWYANGKRIKNQTKSYLTLRSAHRGKRITLRVTVTKAGYKTIVFVVRPTGKVKARRR